MSRKSDNQVVVTRKGYENLTAELTHLRTARRQDVARQLEEARAFGDLSENAEYAAAKEEQSKVEGRILELETMLSKVTIVDEEKLDTDRVAIGLTVTLEDLDTPGKSYIYTLVGSEELSSTGGAPSETHRISQKSPVGQAIMGHVAGDEVVVKIPHGTRHLKVVEISRGNNTKAEKQEKGEAKPERPVKPKPTGKSKKQTKEEQAKPDAVKEKGQKKEKQDGGKDAPKNASASKKAKSKDDSVAASTEIKAKVEVESESGAT